MNEDTQHWPLEKISVVHLEMGQQCNVRCSMCYQTDFSPRLNMPESLWNYKLQPLYSIAQRLVIGGEPTIMSNCRGLLEMVGRDHRHLKVDMVTNGIAFSGFWDSFFLRQGHCLNFSLNAVNPLLYRKIILWGDYIRVVENIRRIVSARNAAKSPLKLRISSVIFSETVLEMPNFFQWAVDHGLDEVLLFTDYFNGIGYAKTADVQKSVAEVYELAGRHPNVRLLLLEDFDWHFARLRGVEPVRSRRILAKRSETCPVAFDTFYLQSDGVVKPCCKSWYIYGNLMKDSLADVWNSRAARRFRRRMRTLDFRDCLVVCDLNARPIRPLHADIRKGYWAIRRNPRTALKKALRKFGLTSAQDLAPKARPPR